MATRARTTTPRNSRTAAATSTSHRGTAGRRGKGGLRSLATVAPLALGLLSTQLPSSQQLGKPTAATRAATHQITVNAGSFTPPCMPFAGVKNPDIDDHCGIQGGSSDPIKQAESRAKNDLCSAKQPPQTFLYQQLLDLQQKVGASGINAKHLADRSPLTDLGEGKYVSYIAFIEEAHYSDVSSGEAVNCNIPGSTTNDIHIVLVKKADDDPCNSTTAEMIPHFRPEAWTPQNLMAVKLHPVRVQGHLFYDGSHTPCTASSRPNPQRASLWEIHPVYSLDVCRMVDLDQCRASTNTGDWVPLEQFVSSETEQE